MHLAVVFNSANDQVFDQSLCLETCKELRDLQLAGKPAVLKKKFTVLQNNWWGILGGWEVEWVVLYLAKSTNFESQLPEETQSKINEGDSGPFANFPIYKTEMQNGVGDAIGLTTEQVNLLAAQGEWSVYQHPGIAVWRAVLHLECVSIDFGDICSFCLPQSQACQWAQKDERENMRESILDKPPSLNFLNQLSTLNFGWTLG
eukprot:s4941_g3.t1